MVSWFQIPTRQIKEGFRAIAERKRRHHADDLERILANLDARVTGPCEIASFTREEGRSAKGSIWGCIEIL